MGRSSSTTGILFLWLVLIFGITYISGVSGAVTECYSCIGADACKDPKKTPCPGNSVGCVSSYNDNKPQGKGCAPPLGVGEAKENCAADPMDKKITGCLCTSNLCNAGFLMKPMSWLYLSWMGLSIAALGSRFIGMPM